MELSPRFSHVTQAEDHVLAPASFPLWSKWTVPWWASDSKKKTTRWERTPLAVCHWGSRRDGLGTTPWQRGQSTRQQVEEPKAFAQWLQKRCNRGHLYLCSSSWIQDPLVSSSLDSGITVLPLPPYFQGKQLLYHLSSCLTAMGSPLTFRTI